MFESLVKFSTGQATRTARASFTAGERSSRYTRAFVPHTEYANAGCQARSAVSARCIAESP